MKLPVAAFAALLALSAPALAHSQQQDTVPADGASVEAAPERIVLRFDHPARVTSIALTGEGGSVPLASEQGTDAVTEYVAQPQDEIVPGAYEVEWRALSADGHPMEGGFGFSVAE